MRTGCVFNVKRCILATAAAAIGLAAVDSSAAEASKCKVARIAEWPLRADSYRPVFDGAINGQKIGILIDTGSAMSFVRRSEAVRLGLTRYETPGTRIIGMGGETHAESVHIDEFRIGQGVRKGWEVLVAGEHGFSSDTAVILGDDYFQQVDVEFDLANKAVRLYETRDCRGVSLAYWATEPAGEVPIEAGSRIWLTIAINGKPVRAELDSGSSASILSKADAARLGVTPQSPGAVAGGCYLDGIGGRRIETWIGQFESFAIGNEIIRNPRIRFADVFQHMTYTETGSRLPTRFVDEPDMLLGADFLRAHRVLVARSQRKMYFTYAGGTVFPSKPWKACSQPAPGDPPPDPLTKQRGQ